MVCRSSALAREDDGYVYVLARSDARVDKERMRRRKLRRYIERLKVLQGQSLTRDQLLMKLAAAKHDAGRAAAASSITPREVIAKFRAIQMVDVHLPTADGRELVLSRSTQLEPDHRVLLDKLHLVLPDQPPPKITARQADSANGTAAV